MGKLYNFKKKRYLIADETNAPLKTKNSKLIFEAVGIVTYTKNQVINWVNTELIRDYNLFANKLKNSFEVYIPRYILYIPEIKDMSLFKCGKYELRGPMVHIVPNKYLNNERHSLKSKNYSCVIYENLKRVFNGEPVHYDIYKPGEKVINKCVLNIDDELIGDGDRDINLFMIKCVNPEEFDLSFVSEYFEKYPVEDFVLFLNKRSIQDYFTWLN